MGLYVKLPVREIPPTHPPNHQKLWDIFRESLNNETWNVSVGWCLKQFQGQVNFWSMKQTGKNVPMRLICKMLWHQMARCQLSFHFCHFKKCQKPFNFCISLHIIAYLCISIWNQSMLWCSCLLTRGQRGHQSRSFHAYEPLTFHGKALMKATLILGTTLDGLLTIYAIQTKFDAEEYLATY